RLGRTGAQPLALRRSRATSLRRRRAGRIDMSDFFASGWSMFIAVATIGGLVACLVLLGFASRRRPMADDNSTGHVFDEDLVEMNNPLPLWWVGLFIVTVVF